MKFKEIIDRWYECFLEEYEHLFKDGEVKAQKQLVDRRIKWLEDTIIELRRELNRTRALSQPTPPDIERQIKEYTDIPLP